MSSELIVVIVLGLFFLLLAIETPIALALGASGVVGTVLLHSFKVADSVLANVPFESTAKYSLIVIPLYIMLGAMATQARIPERIYAMINRFAGRFKGGLAIATIGASGGFAAVSGSSVATAATLGKISVRQMMRHGYSAELATGLVAIGATLGILIPPSIILIMYSIMSGESIAMLFSAGIIPGILSAVAYIVTALILVKRESRLAEQPAVLASVAAGSVSQAQGVTAGISFPGDSAAAARSNTKADAAAPSSLFAEIRSLFWLVAIVAVVVISIFTGLTTLAESAGVAAVFATLAVVAEHFRSGLRGVLGKIRDGLAESASTTSMIFAIVVGAGIFAYFLVSARVPNKLSRWLTEIDAPPLMIVILILALLIPLGMFLESLSVVVIIVPLAYPTVTALGFDGIWFAILLVKLVEIGLLTPPVGMNCFVIAGATGVKLETVFKGVIPFLICEAIIVALLIIFPDIVLFLPNLLESMGS